jgi:hypothetical protein
LGTKGERRANEMILLEINLFAMILLRARLWTYRKVVDIL